MYTIRFAVHIPFIFEVLMRLMVLHTVQFRNNADAHARSSDARRVTTATVLKRYNPLRKYSHIYSLTSCLSSKTSRMHRFSSLSSHTHRFSYQNRLVYLISFQTHLINCIQTHITSAHFTLITVHSHHLHIPTPTQHSLMHRFDDSPDTHH